MWMIFATLVLLAPPEGGPTPFAYVEPAPGDPSEHPPLVALPLVAKPPEGVEVTATFRGTDQRFAQLRYGGAATTRVTIALDRVSRDEVDLYVDAERDRRIEPSDLVPGGGRARRIPFDVIVADGEESAPARRTLVIRIGLTGRTASVATAGYAEGSVLLADGPRPARLADGDADGLIDSPADRIWIDRDVDGRFDAFSEQFLRTPILAMGDDRYAVRSDRLGSQLELEPLVGVGSLSLELPERLRPHLTALRATLVSRDGIAVGLDGLGVTAEAPVGSYRFQAVSMTFDDPGGGRPWTFLFVHDGFTGEVEPAWHELGAGEALALDPIGDPTLSIDLPAPPAVPGESLTIQPRLRTGDGLLINAGYRGSPTMPGADLVTTARVSLCDAAGTTLDAANSGFS